MPSFPRKAASPSPDLYCPRLRYVAMVPPGRRNRVTAVMVGQAVLEPAMGGSMVLNVEGLDKVLQMTAAASNEWGPTKI